MSSDLNLFAMNSDSDEARAVSSVRESVSSEKHQRNVVWARELWKFVSAGSVSSVPEVTREEIEGQSMSVGILRGEPLMEFSSPEMQVRILMYV